MRNCSLLFSDFEANLQILSELKVKKYNMALEIERKYLVVSDSYRALAEKSSHIRQGYLSRDKERTVRVRIVDDKAFLTIKGKNVGDTRVEFEYPIPIEDASELMRLCVGRVIIKTRYYVPYRGKTWEVDEFAGDLLPLVLAEVELSDSSESFELPSFVGKDVTSDPQYYNSNL